jgi:HD-GYP domain-containing protein (c-di-GMP phosphodiesterase class II)
MVPRRWRTSGRGARALVWLAWLATLSGAARSSGAREAAVASPGVDHQPPRAPRGLHSLRDAAAIGLLGLRLAIKDRWHLRSGTAGAHSRGVARFAWMIAEGLREEGRQGLTPGTTMSSSDVRLVLLAGHLHDAGKIDWPQSLLRNHGKLTDAQLALVLDHPRAGAERIARWLSPGPFREQIAESARHHHERLNGQGYPDHLAGAEISRIARIMAVADVFDAMTRRRPYQHTQAMAVVGDRSAGVAEQQTPEQALAFLRARAGTDFDLEIVEVLARQLVKAGRLQPEAVAVR